MIPNPPAKIHVLILHDGMPAVGSRSDERDPEELLPDDPRLRVTVAGIGYGEAVRAAQMHRPDVIVLDGVPGDPAELVAELEEALPNALVLVMVDRAERELVHDCVVAGASGCLERPVDPDTLVQTIFRVHGRATRLRTRLQAEVGASGNEDEGGNLIAVRGAKGGVGCTAVAANLAVAIKRRFGRRVALVDAHFLGGDVPVALDLVPNRSIVDLVPHLHSLDDDLVATTLVEHASGVAVLAAPTDLEKADTITSEQLRRVLEALCARYDYVVVDCSPLLDRNSLLVTDLADLLLLVATPEIAALKNAARFVRLGARLGYSEAKLRLVVNRLKSPGAIARSDFEKHLEYRMSFGIPNDDAMVRALTRGEPLVTFQPGSRAARALDGLARTVVANHGWAGEPAPSRGPRLLRLPSLRTGTPKPGLEAAR